MSCTSIQHITKLWSKTIMVKLKFSIGIVGTKMIKIEISLSFDDGQNAEMDSVMINVRKTKCHVRENCSST